MILFGKSSGFSFCKSWGDVTKNSQLRLTKLLFCIMLAALFTDTSLQNNLPKFENMFFSFCLFVVCFVVVVCLFLLYYITSISVLCPSSLAFCYHIYPFHNYISFVALRHLYSNKPMNLQFPGGEFAPGGICVHDLA